MANKWQIAGAITASLMIGITPVYARDAHQEGHERCFQYQATIVGTEGDDMLVGTPAQDVIVGLGGDDTIRGLEGDDRLCGGDGIDLVMGDDGADFVKGGSGGDVVRGGPGNDRIMGNDGDDLLLGGSGNDLMRGSSETIVASPNVLERDALFGGDDDDFLMDGSGIDRLDGGSDTDSIGYGSSASLIDLTQGIAVSESDAVDHLFSIENVYANIRKLGRPWQPRGGDPVIVGDDNDNILIGSNDGDHIYGRGGNDFIDGYCGTDPTLDGGEGDRDVLAFGCVFGVTADLELSTATSLNNGYVETFSGFEGLVGGFAGDTLSGDDGPNLLLGLDDNDLLLGLDGDDVIGGGEGFDTVDAGEGNDVCLWVEDWLGCEMFAETRSTVWPFAETFPTGYN